MQVKRICPNDPDATKKLKECEKAVMKLKFEEAIAVPESERRSVADSIDYQTIGKLLFSFLFHRMTHCPFFVYWKKSLLLLFLQFLVFTTLIYILVLNFILF